VRGEWRRSAAADTPIAQLAEEPAPRASQLHVYIGIVLACAVLLALALGIIPIPAGP
jgi:hypothetical protein